MSVADRDLLFLSQRVISARQIAGPALRGKGDSAIALSRFAAVEQRHARIPREGGRSTLTGHVPELL